jgi:hypothetical protein
MNLKPKYHYQWFEDAPKFEDDPTLVKLNSYTWARKTNGIWRLGWGRDRHWNGEKRRPIEVNFYGLDFFRDKIIMSKPNAGKALGIQSQSQNSRMIKSPIYTYGPIVVQGEGQLVIDHDPDGTLLTVRTERPALQKIWDKQKYEDLKATRQKAERTLKVMMKMGVLEGDKEAPKAYWYGHLAPDFDKINYGRLLDQLANADGKVKDKELDRLATLIHKADGFGGFEYVQRKFREIVYQQKEAYQWLPVEDGRDRVDLR